MTQNIENFILDVSYCADVNLIPSHGNFEKIYSCVINNNFGLIIDLCNDNYTNVKFKIIDYFDIFTNYDLNNLGYSPEKYFNNLNYEELINVIINEINYLRYILRDIRNKINS